MTQAAVESKYYLKSVHAEIDLFDRRLAHLMKYDVFESEAARAAAARKLSLKREPLVQTAKRLAAEGVEFKETELPRSFRPEGSPAPLAEVKAEPETVVAAPVENRTARRQGSPYAGTSLDWEKSVQHYMEKKASRE
jgi:DNA polymerase III gamma/tau subunit